MVEKPKHIFNTEITFSKDIKIPLDIHTISFGDSYKGKVKNVTLDMSTGDIEFDFDGPLTKSHL